MKPVIFYLLQVILSCGILYGYYHFFLRNKKFHQYNRYYLLLATVISTCIPFLNIPVYFNTEDVKPVLLQGLTVFSSERFEENVVIETAYSRETWLTWKNILSTFYLLMAIFLFIRFIMALIRIARLVQVYPGEKIDTIHFVATSEPAAPFSFFRWLFWNNKIELNSDNGQQIFRHELFHIRQKHSWDIIFLELITMIFWINPFFHLIKKEIKVIHEFLADQFAANENQEWDYAELLLMQVLDSSNTRLTHPFFHNQIKRRIAMLTTSKKPGYQYMRKIMVLPVTAIVIILFAFTYKSKLPDKAIWSEKPITIVVDAGHGGNDPGAISPDKKYKEAQLSLELAKTVENLAKEYNITVVMTREDEKFPGDASDKNEANRKRVTLSNELKADAFISIHLSATPDEEYQNRYSGFEAYISKKRDAEEDKKLASVILQDLSLLYKTRTEARIRSQEGIWVLDQSKCPAVILECGFINNEADISFVKNKDNQEKIARSILESIVKYKMAGSANSMIQQNLVNDTIPGSKDDNKIFERLEIEPAFPGGQAAWSQYIEKHVDTNLPIKSGAPAGNYTVFVQFVVDKEGNIKDIRPLTKHGYSMEDQLIEAIKKGPKWIPGKQNGFKVNAYRKQRFTFVVPAKNDGAAVISNGTLQPNSEVVVAGYASPKRGVKPVFEKAEIDPSFPGGDAAWRKYLERNANSMIPVDSGAPAGIYKVMVQYIVSSDGTIEDIKALTNHGYGMEAEAIRLIKNGPQWIPAIQNGKKVSTYRKQPITFIVEEEKESPVTILKDHPGILYIGVENPMEIKVPDVKNEKIIARLNKGSLKRENGKWIASVSHTGETILTVSINENGKERNLGNFLFNAKPVPPPGKNDPITVYGYKIERQ